MKASEYKISLDKFPRDRNEEKGLSQVYGQASFISSCEFQHKSKSQ
jgi:hypothetical protein